MPQPGGNSGRPMAYMSYSLHSFKGVYIGDYIGDYYRVIEGYTRNLDSSSYGIRFRV